MPTTTRVHAGLSDLFFNHSHDNFDACFRDPKKQPPLDQQRAAILADAKEFCEQLANTYVGCEEDPEALADDFIGRV